MIKFALSSQTLDRKSTRKIQRAFSEAPIIHFVYGVLAGFAGSWVFPFAMGILILQSDNIQESKLITSQSSLCIVEINAFKNL